MSDQAVSSVGQRSLFGEILDWMFTPLLLLWPISLAITWVVAQGIANKPFDRALEYNVQALAQIVAQQDWRTPFNLSLPINKILHTDDTNQIYYQVMGIQGEFLSGESTLSLPEEMTQTAIGVVQFRDDELFGQDVRVAYLWVRVPLKNSEPALVQLAETREKRSLLAAEIIKGVMLPQFFILPLAAFLVWFALMRGIRPLSQLEQRIRERRSDDLSPLDERVVPLEVAPLVLSVNDLLTRLGESIAAQKRFLADAAHQLKTPLAGLRMQADLAQRQGASAQELKLSLRHIEHASMRATHTVNQLLALARAEYHSTQQMHQPCNVPHLVTAVIQDCLPYALEKHIDLGYDGISSDTPEAFLRAHPMLLKEMIRNLVDNAINYTPSSAKKPGVVTVRVYWTANHVNHVDKVDKTDKKLLLCVEVEDSGPGIAHSERELVFQPFYRALGSQADGSGLGLAIVREIAQQHGAEVCVEDAHPGQQPVGARFRVSFYSGTPVVDSQVSKRTP